MSSITKEITEILKNEFRRLADPDTYAKGAETETLHSDDDKETNEKS